MRMAMYALCVWIGSITLAASAVLALTSVPSQADDEWKSCIYNGKESFFRPDDEACCQGNILPRAENLEEACCNGQLYDSTTGKCCGDHTWINIDTQLCCGGEVHAISEHAECCNHQWINTTAQTCCPGGVVEGVGECCGYSDVYNDMTEHCCLGPGSAGHVAAVGREAVVSGFLECCGSETIDTRNKLCCLDNPIDRKSSFTECCGADTYDTRTQVCCESGIEYRISPLVDGKVECCGLVTYNEDTDQCCESVITPNIGEGACCGAEAYNPLRSSCCYPSPVSLSIPTIPGVQDCCSGVSYLKTQQVCCGNALHDLEPGKECCGNSLYDVTNQLCCKGNIMEKAAPTSQCCGGSNTFDPERQTCCGWQVSDFPYGSCCRIRRNAFQAYQPGESKCCSRSPPNKYFHKRFAFGRVQSIDAECCGIHALADGQLCDPCSKRPVANDSFTDACCSEGNKNPKAYNKETHICYENEVYAKKQFQLGRAPCGDKVYTTDTEICCDGTIHPKMYQAKKPHQQKCCGTEAYVPDWHTCVGNSQKKNKNVQSYRHLQVNKKVPEHFAEYCQDNVFNNQTDVCDRSNWHIRPIEEMELGLKACDSFKAERGYYPYDPTEKECCGGVLIGPGETCCLETLRISTPGTGFREGRCCGSEGFNPHTHVCCDEVLHPITAPGQECCGRELFDPSSPAPMCCNDTLLSTADGKTVCTDGVAHRPTDTVCQGSVYPVENGECCGPVLMDSSTEICCQEKFLYPRGTHGNTCCGRVAYDTLDESKKCCMDSLLHDAQNSAVCCHSRIMDPFTETCRAVGDVHYSFPKNFFRPEGEIVPGHTVCNGLEYPFSGECCGNEIVGSSEVGAICCGGRKQFHGHGQQAMCCSGEVFDSERYTCCGEKPLEKHHHWMTCCNGEPMGRRQCRPRRPPGDNQACNPSKMSCCNGQIYNAPMKCCNSQIYDPELYNCSSDNVLQPFCGGAAYDNSTLICCSGATYDASSTGCCNGEHYILGKSTCCAEKLYRVKNGSCCGLLGDKAYNQNRYLCCDNSLRRKKKGRSQCCGSSAYNPETDTCCNQSLTRGTRRGSCCGDRAFDPTQKLCCPKTEKLSRRRDDSVDISEQCCAPGFEYDKDAGACQQQDCRLCKNLRSTKGWQSHTSKPTLIRGTASNLTSTPSHHVLHLTGVSHLNHNKRQSSLDSRELDVTIPGHCQRCPGKLLLGKAYVVMSDAEVVPEGADSASLTLRTTDFLARARDKLGMKIKHRLCRLG